MKNYIIYWAYKILPFVILSIFTSNCSKSKDDIIPDNAVKDIDGNVYNTVKIGDQVWMVENLRTTTFADGEPILHADSSNPWNQPRYSWPNNDLNNKEKYGALYNGRTIKQTSLIIYHEIAPDGWRVASTSDWTTLINYLGGDSIAGGKLKSIGILEEGTGLWSSPNTGATNESGFSALPTGSFNYHGYWWAVNYLYAGASLQYYTISYNTSNVLCEDPTNFEYFYSIRCIKK